MKSKNIYEILNEVKTDFDDYEIEELSEFEKKKMKDIFKKSIKKSQKKRNGFLKIAAVFILGLGILSQTDAGRIVYAKAESIASEIFGYNIKKGLNLNEDLSSYTKVIGTSVRDKGVEVTLSDVAIDNGEFVFSIIISSDEYRIEGMDYNLKINGKKAIVEGSRGSAQTLKLNDKPSYVQTSVAIVKGLNDTKQMDVELRLDKIYRQDAEPLKGNWIFKFKADGNSLAKDTVKIDLDHSFKIGENNYKILYYKGNALDKKFILQKDDTKGEDYIIKLEGVDNLGNPVMFETHISEKNKMEVGYEPYFSSLSKDARYMILTPYASKIPNESGNFSSQYQKVGKEFKVNLK